MKIWWSTFVAVLIVMLIGVYFENLVVIYVGIVIGFFVGAVLLLIPNKKYDSNHLFSNTYLDLSAIKSSSNACSECGRKFGLALPDTGYGVCRSCIEKQSLALNPKAKPIAETKEFPDQSEW